MVKVPLTTEEILRELWVKGAQRNTELEITQRCVVVYCCVKGESIDIVQFIRRKYVCKEA